MQLHTAKQEAIDVINHLPDTANWDDIVYQLWVLKKIHQGLEQAELGQGINTEELLREIEKW
jgi:predicted transcriptional regulator